MGEDDQDSEGGCFNGCCAYVLIIVSVFLVIMFFPLSLIFLIKVMLTALWWSKAYCWYHMHRLSLSMRELSYTVWVG